jgi:hypothetical protein
MGYLSCIGHWFTLSFNLLTLTKIWAVKRVIKYPHYLFDKGCNPSPIIIIFQRWKVKKNLKKVFWARGIRVIEWTWNCLTFNFKGVTLIRHKGGMGPSSCLVAVNWAKFTAHQHNLGQFKICLCQFLNYYLHNFPCTTV